MLDAKALKKIFESVYSAKRLKRVEQEGEKLIQVKMKQASPVKKVLKRSKSSHKDLFAPMNSFVSVTSNLNVSKLYKYKLLPSQILSTSKSVIKKLTRKIYILPKQEEFPLNLSCNECKKLGFKPKTGLNPLFKEGGDRASFDLLNRTCEEFLKENQKSRHILQRKKKLLNKKIIEAKRTVNSIEKSNKRVGYFMFHSKLREGHSQLVKLDMIHPKPQD